MEKLFVKFQALLCAKKVGRSVLLLALISFWGCTGVHQDSYDSLQQKYDSLEEENAQLKSQVEELQNTPANLLASGRDLLASGDTYKAKGLFNKLINKFPSSEEAVEASRIVADLEKKEKDALEEAEKEAREKAEKEAQKQALGFKVLKESSTVSYGDLTVKFTSVTSGKRWTHDAYENRYFYHDAERDEMFVMARISITSKSKYPSLPPIGVYEYKDGSLHLLEVMEYKFARWKDYGTYLGNYADYGNDFCHTSTVSFSNAATIDKDTYNNSAIFVVMKKEGVFERKYDKYSRPEVSYEASSYSSMDYFLGVDDFDSKYQLVKILNKNKM